MFKKCFVLFVFTLCFCTTTPVFAVSDESGYNVPEPDYEDPSYLKILNQSSQVSAQSASGDMVSPFTGQFYTHHKRYADSNVVLGIDVSKWQGEIDWKKVKDSGVEFVFIRCGYTPINDPFRTGKDTYFDANVKGAYDAGLKIGTYFFSNAKTASEVKQELKKTLAIIEPYRSMITLPVVYDFEAFTKDYRAYDVSKARATKNAIIFMDGVREAGFEPMYYGCPDVFDHRLDTSQLKDYKCWLANYTNETAYQGGYQYWQYSETGHVNGISTPVDCDFYYDFDGVYSKDPAIGSVNHVRMSSNTTSWIKIRWSENQNATGYKIYRSDSLNGKYKKIATIKDRNITYYKDTSVVKSNGRMYYYRVVPYLKSDKLVYGEPSEIIYANTRKTYKSGVKLRSDLNVRIAPGTNYSVIGSLSKGSEHIMLGYAYDKFGSRWYKIRYGSDIGYISGDYAKVLSYGKLKNKAVVKSGAWSQYKSLRTLPVGRSVVIVKIKTNAAKQKWAYVRYKIGGKNQYGWVKYAKIKRIVL